MKQFESEKYTVAWYRLAEFVARGEKERALALYRLLVHSFDDQALAHQLEGDLLMSFNDIAAIQCYKKAIALFVTQKRFIEAAAVYEHICTVEPQNNEALHELLGLYVKLQHCAGFIATAKKLIDLYVQDHAYEATKKLCASYETQFPEVEINKLYAYVVLQLIKKQANDNLIKELLENVLERFVLSDNPKQLQSFLSQLKATNSHYVELVSRWMANN